MTRREYRWRMEARYRQPSRPFPRETAGLPFEGVRPLSRRPREDPTSGQQTDAFEPTCSVSKAPHPSLMPLVVLLGRCSLRCALHRGETRLCISLPFSVCFKANTARKRPEANRGKTRSCRMSGSACWSRHGSSRQGKRRGESWSASKHPARLPDRYAPNAARRSCPASSGFWRAPIGWSR